MIIQTWGNVLSNSFLNLWSGVVNFVPQLIIAILIIVIGWLIGALIGRVVAQIIRSLRVDEGLRKAGVEDTLARGGIVLNSGNFIGGLVKWFIILVFLIAALDVLHLTQVNEFLQGVVLFYLPQVIIAVLILMLAAVIGDIMQKVVTTSAKTAEIKSARFLGSFTKWSIWIFAVLAALLQLNIAAAFIQTIFTGIVVALSLAAGLAFGLGGQEAAARFIEKTRQEISHKE
jgi:small-conductance mechanosensitive channel